MKNFIKSFLMFAAVFMLFASCGNISNATVSGDEGKAVIQVGIEGYEVYNGYSKTSRTVNPTPYTKESVFTKVTIKGESENGNNMDEETLVFETSTSGSTSTKTAKIELSYDVWYLTMSAYDGADNLVLQGFKRIDMRNGAPASNAPITFKLSADGVPTVGAISLKGTFTDTNKLVSKYSAALYNIDTNEKIADSEKAGTCKDDSDADKSTIGKFAYEISNVKPGRYNFRINFMMTSGTDAAAKDVVIGTWGDVVVVAPGRTTKDESLSLGNVLYSKPTKPENLSVYYVKDSGKEGMYNVLVTWEDKSNNEEFFRLTVKDVTGSTPVDYKIFGDETDNKTEHVKEVFWESKNRVSGTLTAGAQYCELKLPTNKKYEFYIEAVNFIGSSATEGRKKDNTDAYSGTIGGYTVPANESYGEENVNLMEIHYDLNGGILLTKSGDVVTKKTGTVIEYHIFKGTDINLMTIPAPADTVYPKLEKDHHPFLQWNDESIAGTDKKIVKLSAFGKKTVVASYNLKTIINYEIDDSYGVITATAKVADASVKNGDVPAGNPNIVFGVVKIVEDEEGNKSTVEDTDVIHLEIHFLTVDGNDLVREGDGTSYTFTETSSLKSGTTVVQVIATKKDNKKYSDTFAITINR